MPKPECLKYLEDVRDGRIVACKRIKQLADIFIPRIENPYKTWHFDYAKANRPVEFIEKFCCYPAGEKMGRPMLLEPFQKACIQLMFGFVDDEGKRQFREVLWLIGRKNGKALSLDTPIPTPTGYKQMKDIHTGDYVLGVEGQPVMVVAESEIFDKPMYAVTFEDGEVIKASEDHVWTVKTKKRGLVDMTTGEMSDSYFHIRRDGKGTEYRYRVPMNQPILYDEKDLPIDPYVLGVWLGDGYSSGNNICVGEQDIDEMLELLADYNPVAVKRRTAYAVKLGNFYRHSGVIPGNDFKDDLKFLDLIDNKHIPEIYLRGSVEQRIALLQGLMDTDGFVSKAGQCEFSQKKGRLAEDVIELLSGLGIKNTYNECEVECNGRICEAYKIRFFTDKAFPCFRMKRKVARLKDHLAPRMQHKSIRKIERIPNEPSKCIAVDSPDHLYLCGKHYTATHNTSLGAALELYMLLADGEGAPQIYNAATSKDQASLAYGALWKMAKKSPKLNCRVRKGTVVERDSDGMIYDKNFGYITPLSSQTRHLDGLDVHFVLFDEIAACVNRDMYDLIYDGMASRSQPMMLCITTNGFERNNIFDDRYEYGCRILNGEIEDDVFLPILYELDNRNEWVDESAWIKANPGLGTIKNFSFLKDKIKEASENPNKVPTVLTKDFNIPENKAAAWLSFDEAVNTEPFEMERGMFRYGIAGFDASDTTDLSAACMLMMRPDDPKIYKLSMYWLPEESLEDDGYRRERDDAPYKMWEARGLLRLVPGNKVPKSVFVEWLEEVKREWDVWTFALGYDPWHIIGTDEMAVQQYVGKERAEKIIQGPKTLSDPMKQIRADYKGNRIVDGNHPIDTWCRMNTSVKTDVNANIQPVKLDKSSKNRIDGFMAEICAYIALLRHEEEYRNVI